MVDDLLGHHDPDRVRSGLAHQHHLRLLSLWALVSGHWSAWQAARVEVAQQEQIDAEADDPVEHRVVDEMVERTEIDSEPRKDRV